MKGGLQVCSQLGHNTTRKEAIGTGCRGPKVPFLNRYPETGTFGHAHQYRVKKTVPKPLFDSIFVKNGWPGFELRISYLTCIFFTISLTHHF